MPDPATLLVAADRLDDVALYEVATMLRRMAALQLSGGRSSELPPHVMAHTSVTFRGRTDVSVGCIHYAEDPSTDAVEVEWIFTDDDMRDVDDLTPEEDEAITSHVIEIMSDPHRYDD